MDSVNPYAIKISPWIAHALQKQNSELTLLFRTFLTTYLDGSYWQMCTDVDRLKTMEPDQVKTTVESIYEKYWSTTSDFDIQIKPKVKDTLKSRVETGNIDSAIFDEAMKELEEESYKKFLRSDVYAGTMADKGVFVRTSSPKRRVSITELFKKKGADGRRRSSLCTAAWQAPPDSPVLGQADCFTLDGRDAMGNNLDLDNSGSDYDDDDSDDEVAEAEVAAA